MKSTEEREREILLEHLNMELEQWKWTRSSVPDDIALEIVSFLQVTDVCALGSCSRFWRELCASDCLWLSLSRQRWPSLDFSSQPPVLEVADGQPEKVLVDQSSSTKGWRDFYIKRHNEMTGKATAIVNFVELCSPSKSIEVADYLKAIANLCLMKMEFEDVQMFLFTKQNVLLNLIGLHYSIFWLQIEADSVTEALCRCDIAEQQVCVRWWKLGRWFYGFRLRDESHSRTVLLRDLAMAREEEVFGVLNRGAIHEVLRVQISDAVPSCTSWAFPDMQRQG
ncbi:PREDICTED: uncharacterized protein LOC104587608 isoform X1 [Nelumbo nucifera]|uniref:Uncharacterized protein LOC104587608 isoform X1 n=1 Tax=Nelumbo nucifera TaxID=4432 RepID=A0A1U7YTE1_NELNU|nr:PREDICTED: uncharacterized protein LOC104587608 isoform X1 [Nelumbo nucifera]